MVMMRSSDHGKTWEELDAGCQEFSVDTDPDIPGRVYIICTWEGQIKLMWADGYRYWYQDWNDIREPFQIQAPADLIFLPASANAPVRFLVSNRDLFFETTGWLCQSTNSGKRFRLAGTINRLFIATTTGVSFSTDGCRTWNRTNNGSDMGWVNTIYVDPNDPDTVYAGTNSGAFVSFDGGETWGQVNDGLLGVTVVYSIVVDKDSNVYAATPYGILKLENK
jgi:hypothetical protein